MKELKELEHFKRDLLKEAHVLMEFLCEDKDAMKLDECFQIFRDFCLRFNKAVKVIMIHFHFKTKHAPCFLWNEGDSLGNHGSHHMAFIELL